MTVGRMKYKNLWRPVDMRSESQLCTVIKTERAHCALNTICLISQFALHLGNKIPTGPFHKEIPQVRKCANLHLTLRVLVFCAHMWQQRVLRELEQAWVDIRLVRIDVESY